MSQQIVDTKIDFLSDYINTSIKIDKEIAELKGELEKSLRMAERFFENARQSLKSDDSSVKRCEFFTLSLKNSSLLKTAENLAVNYDASKFGKIEYQKKLETLFCELQFFIKEVKKI